MAFDTKYLVPEGTEAGSPLVVNGVPIVTTQPEGDIIEDYATARSEGTYLLSVQAIDDSGNTTVRRGDYIYYNKNDTPVLSCKRSGEYFGKAVSETATDLISYGETGTISVVVGQDPIMIGKGTYCEFKTNPVSAGVAGGAATGTAGDVNVINIDGDTFEYCMLGTQTILAPEITAAGLNWSLDQTEDDGVIVTRGITARNPESFVVGTDKAFFAKFRATIANVSGTDDFAFGFVKATAYPANFDDFTDAAVLNVISGAIYTETILNNAATTSTDTTDTWADGEKHELEVRVDANGVVSFLIDGVAPTVTQSFTFDDGDRVFPCFFFLHAAAPVAGAIPCGKWHTGYQKD